VREILPSRWVCDGSVFPELFGWKPSKNLFQSLAETASWLRNGGRIR
jgi:hypothetical protein